jgi:CRP/FNR family transcriptional regulator, cyclic AMP receptor protein
LKHTLYAAGRSAIISPMPSPNETVLRQRDAEKRSVLQNHYLFSKLNPKHIERLVFCIVEKSFRRGTTIFAKGDPGSSLFAVSNGAVRITVPSVEGHEAMFNLIGKGEIFGEIALLDGRSRTADAVAITDCTLFIIERRDFLPMVREEPEIGLKLIEILCARLRQTTDQAENLMFLPLPCRLAKALLRLSGTEKDASGQKVVVTQNDLGKMIGMSRESANRQLRIWEQRKWVRLGRGEIVILSTKALQRVADGECELA